MDVDCGAMEYVELYEADAPSPERGLLAPMLRSYDRLRDVLSATIVAAMTLMSPSSAGQPTEKSSAEK